jgi:ribosome-associated toxin RatA of RatAB toxin-antitoxin module
MATHLFRTANVPYSPEQMYTLVNDIEQYPDFLPWCEAAEILLTHPNNLHASLQFAKGFWRQTFSTANQLIPHQEIRMQLLNGPFKFLEGVWTFQPLISLGTKVNLDLRFEFNNALLGFTMGPLFQQLSTQVMQAFTERAQMIYGK